MKTILSEHSIENLNAYVFSTYNQMYGMAAVWLEKKMNVVRAGISVPTLRIANDEFVKAIDGVIVNAEGNDATHQITKILGTIRHSNNDFKIEARNLLTGNIEPIKLPPLYE